MEMFITTAPAEVESPATTARAARHHSAGYFSEVEAHWQRMLDGSPNKLMHFAGCLLEGAACVRAGYSRDRFRTLFTELAKANGLVGELGGPDGLKEQIAALVDYDLDNCADTFMKNFEATMATEDIAGRFDQVLRRNDEAALQLFLRNRSMEELTDIEAHLQRTIR